MGSFFVRYDFFKDDDFDIVEGEYKFKIGEGDSKTVYKVQPNGERQLHLDCFKYVDKQRAGTHEEEANPEEVNIDMS